MEIFRYPPDGVAYDRHLSVVDFPSLVRIIITKSGQRVAVDIPREYVMALSLSLSTGMPITKEMMEGMDQAPDDPVVPSD